MKKTSKIDQLLAKIEALEKQVATLKEQVAKIPATTEVHNHFHAAPAMPTLVPSTPQWPQYGDPSITPMNPFQPPYIVTCNARGQSDPQCLLVN